MPTIGDNAAVHRLGLGVLRVGVESLRIVLFGKLQHLRFGHVVHAELVGVTGHEILEGLRDSLSAGPVEKAAMSAVRVVRVAERTPFPLPRP